MRILSDWRIPLFVFFAFFCCCYCCWVFTNCLPKNFLFLFRQSHTWTRHTKEFRMERIAPTTHRYTHSLTSGVKIDENKYKQKHTKSNTETKRFFVSNFNFAIFFFSVAEFSPLSVTHVQTLFWKEFSFLFILLLRQQTKSTKLLFNRDDDSECFVSLWKNFLVCLDQNSR